MGVEILRASEHFGRNLIFLWRRSGVIERKGREVTKQFAERLRPMEGMAAEKFLDLCEMQGSLSHGDHRAGIVTPR